MDLSTAELTERVRIVLKALVSSERYEHSVRVAETADLLCVAYGENRELGYFAGLSHDMCKNLSDDEILVLAKLDGLCISKEEQSKGRFLHGRAAAVFLNKRFGVQDAAVLEAVRWHQSGFPGMGSLAKIIFIADKTEPGRAHSTAEYRKKIFSQPLDVAALTVLSENIEYSRKKGLKPFANSLALQSELLKGVHN